MFKNSFISFISLILKRALMAMAGADSSSYLFRSFAASSTSVATATFLTNFIDVVKVRQQLAGAASTNMARYV